MISDMEDTMTLKLVPAPTIETIRQQEPFDTCPVCGATIERQKIGQKLGWSCAMGGFAHYYQVKYGYLKQWFTSGQGNLREPVINAMNCVQADYAA